MKEIQSIADEISKKWKMPEIPTHIPQGDMPGDKVEIGESHIHKASLIFPRLIEELKKTFEKNQTDKAVICVCGGSGVGKSEIASLLSYLLNNEGIGSYTLSGDNYPHRFPKYNDAERLHIFRESGLQAMVADESLTPERFEKIQAWQKEGMDADATKVREYPWYQSYIDGAKAGLSAYLGTNREIGFDEVEKIVSAFKSGKDSIWLKRMGREESELWYEKVDFSRVQVLVIEWTHGNSEHYQGVDIPILLNSTPKETLEHRRMRNRDNKVDSPFTMTVLNLEQRMLQSQAHKAKIIVSKAGELLDFESYKALMEKEG